MTFNFQEPEVHLGEGMSNSTAGEIKFLVKIAGEPNEERRPETCAAAHKALLLFSRRRPKAPGDVMAIAAQQPFLPHGPLCVWVCVFLEIVFIYF